MPTNETNNQSTNNEMSQNTQDATAGDILEQLKADSVNDSNLYKLGLKLQKTIINIDKTFTKQQKVINQSKKNLDNITAAVTSISKDSTAIKTTLSSVDTSLKQLFNLLEKVHDSNINIEKSISPVLTSVDNSLKQIYSLLEQYQDALNSQNDPARTQNQEQTLTSINDRLTQLTDTLSEVRDRIPEFDVDSISDSLDTIGISTLEIQSIISDIRDRQSGWTNTGDSGNPDTYDSVLTSVDTHLEHIIHVLESFETSGIPTRSSSRTDTSSSSGRGSGFMDNLGIRMLYDRISQYEADLERIGQERDAGTMPESDYLAESIAINQAIADARAQIRDLEDAILRLARQYDNVDTVEARFNDSINQISADFAANNISLDELQQEMRQSREALDSHQEALRDAEAAWNNNGNFSFAREGEELRRQINDDFDQRKADLFERFNRQIPDEAGNIMDEDAFNQALESLMGERADALSSATGFGGVISGVDSISKVGASLDKLLENFRNGNTFNVNTGENNTASAVMSAVGEIGGTLAGAEVGAAIGTAIGGPVGTIVGGIVGDVIGSKIEALATLIGSQLDYLANHSKKTRDEILQAGIDKIRSDVKDMATYSIEIYETSAKNIYEAWDKNLAQVTATQGYTKEALNSLQDAVAQRLQAEGYGSTINASEYLDSLANTLTANLGGTLAEAFAAQNLILQKAVPEVDLSAQAAQFAAIYANANRQTGLGEETMISAMNEIAGAAKALETVTEGNNQFLKETGNLLQKATEVVQIAGGNADQISGLTTQMMASEAAITSVAPQLSGFTSELVSVLMSNNDSTAVALRAIMNDINNNIGVSATSFMRSFMEDTQGTLSTAFAAIQKFIDQNENEASRQEFLHAMETVFGVQGSKLAQIDFGSVAELISQVSTSVNMAALTNAENLVRSGETTSLEEQLVANTTNQLLATNAISSTLDNKLMRKLETNELAMERLVYSAQATQSVDLAENTLGFFTKVADLIMSILDPLGLFDMFTTSINAATSAAIDAERYVMTATMSSIGSTVADGFEGTQNTLANTIGGASAVMAAATTKSTDAMVWAVENSGVSPTFESMLTNYAQASKDAQAAIAATSAESNVISYASMEQQARQSSEYQQKQTAAQEQDAKYEEEKAAAREQQKAQQQEEDLRNIENHDNIIIIKDALDGLDMSSYLQPILDEHRTHTEQIKELQGTTSEVVKLLSTMIEYQMVTSPEFASTISFDERSRIMDNGYISSSVSNLPY